MLVIAFLLLGQFSTLSHSVDHDSQQSSCVVCRISKPHKEVPALLTTAGAVVPAREIDPVFVEVPSGLKSIAHDIALERAPPIPS